MNPIIYVGLSYAIALSLLLVLTLFSLVDMWRQQKILKEYQA